MDKPRDQNYNNYLQFLNKLVPKTEHFPINNIHLITIYYEHGLLGMKMQGCFLFLTEFKVLNIRLL